MYFTFGYNREAPVEVERRASTLVLLALGMAVMLLVIFLSFENAYGATLTSHLSFGAPCGSMQVSAGDTGWEMNSEQSSWRSELRSSPPVAWNS